MKGRKSWVIQSSDTAVLLHRKGAALRWDIKGMALLHLPGQKMTPDRVRRRVAQQIRQDLWRMLQGLRGFSPMVEVTGDVGHLRVVAGGSVQPSRPLPGLWSQKITTMLETEALQKRWISHAVKGQIL